MKELDGHSTPTRGRVARNAAGRKSKGRRVARFWHSNKPGMGRTGIYIDNGNGDTYVAYVWGELLPVGRSLISALDDLPNKRGENFMNSHYVEESK